MGFDCVICWKLLEEEPDPQPTTTALITNSKQIQIPTKRPQNSINSGSNYGNRASTSKKAKQQQQQPLVLSSAQGTTNNNNENSISIVATACGHLFHKICIEQWSTKAGNCPKCREPCSMAQLTTIYPDINTDKEIELQESQVNVQKLEIQLHSVKSDHLTLTSKNSKLKSALTKSRNSNSIVMTSMELINGKCKEKEAEIRELKRELEQLQNQCSSGPVGLIKHFKTFEDKMEGQVHKILNKLDVLSNQSTSTASTSTAPVTTHEGQEELLIQEPNHCTSSASVDVRSTSTTQEASSPVAKVNQSDQQEHLAENVPGGTFAGPFGPATIFGNVTVEETQESVNPPITSKSTSSLSSSSVKECILPTGCMPKKSEITVFLENRRLHMDKKKKIICKVTPSPPRLLILPPREIITPAQAIKMCGTYELISSRNFKSYLQALGIKVDKYLRSQSNAASVVSLGQTARKSPRNTIAACPWERELATVDCKATSDNAVGGTPTDFLFSITTSYYYNRLLHTTKRNFTLGQVFSGPVEGTGVEDHESEGIQHLKTLVRMEYDMLKQIQTYRSTKITVWREFNGKQMRVTIGNSNSNKSCVRVYEKIKDGELNWRKKQEGCREIATSDEENDEYDNNCSE